MAVDMFLELTNIKGETVDKSFAGKKAIDVLAWSWGGSQSATTHAGPGGGAGKVNIQDLSITKYVDAASPTLLQYMCKGQHIAKGTLSVRKAGGTAPVSYIVLEFEECLISSLSTGGSGGEDRLTENLTLNFAKFKFVYTPQDAKGTAGTAIPVSWDISINADS